MRYFSMFSGIGGFELGIQYAETKSKNCTNGESGTPQLSGRSFCVGYSEINKYAIQCYESHFKGHVYYGDVTQIIPEEIPDFDLLVAGFPCQAFSIAGKRRGFDESRGTLFFEIARILANKRPKHFLLENVKGLLSHDNGKTFQTIIGILTELGYCVEWQVLNSKDFGVPQNRERVFIVGHLGGIGGRKVFPIYGSNEKNLEQIIGGGQGNRVYRTSGTSGTSTTIASQAGGQGAKTGLYAVPTKFLDRNQRNYQGEYNFTVDTVGTGGILKDYRIRRLTPTECERLQGFPDGWTSMLSDTQRYKCLGNAVTVNVIEAIISKIVQV